MTDQELVAKIEAHVEALNAEIAAKMDERDRWVRALDALRVALGMVGEPLQEPAVDPPLPAVPSYEVVPMPDPSRGRPRGQTAAPGVNQDDALRFLAEPKRTGDVAAHFHAAHDDTRKILKRLQDAGLVTVAGKTNSRFWSLTPEGRREIGLPVDESEPAASDEPRGDCEPVLRTHDVPRAAPRAPQPAHRITRPTTERYTPSPSPWENKPRDGFTAAQEQRVPELRTKREARFVRTNVLNE